MNLEQIVTRLKAEAVPPLKMVGKSGDIPSAQEMARGGAQSPSAFVLPIGDDAGRNSFATGVHIQQITDTFGVLIVVRDLSDPKGGAAAESFTTIKAAVRNALVAWTPGHPDSPIELIDGRMVDFINGAMWWLERYRSSWQLRKT